MGSPGSGEVCRCMNSMCVIFFFVLCMYSTYKRACPWESACSTWVHCVNVEGVPVNSPYKCLCAVEVLKKGSHKTSHGGRSRNIFKPSKDGRSHNRHCATKKKKRERREREHGSERAKEREQGKRERETL